MTQLYQSEDCKTLVCYSDRVFPSLAATKMYTTHTNGWYSVTREKVVHLTALFLSEKLKCYFFGI